MDVLLARPFPHDPVARAGQGQLPTPTGPFGIGLTTFDWTDTTRLETQSGKAGQHRELLVYLLTPSTRCFRRSMCLLPTSERDRSV